MQIFLKIRNIVKLIPPGRVATYGQIARLFGTSPRVVGWALRGNQDLTIPCHRVVKSGGVLADKFSLGNWPEQRRRLELEGIKFNGQQILDFNQKLIDLTRLRTS